jgi:hypothetical protein
MKIIEFGFNDSDNPSCARLGIGMDCSSTGIVDGKLIGFVCTGEENYLVTKAIKCFKNNGDLEGKIDVRRAVADIFKDGSGTLFLDQKHDINCQKLEKLLNVPSIKDKIENGVSLDDICRYANIYNEKTDFSYNCATNEDKIFATAIKHNEFNKKKYLIDNCRDSFSQLAYKNEMVKESDYNIFEGMNFMAK